MEVENTILSINTTNHFILDEELIVFSNSESQYFGVSGAARLVFDALINANGSAPANKIERLVANSGELTLDEITLIREAIASLLELGVVREQ